MNQALVTVCIPCYNAESYVSQAIESILAQTWPNVELIIVNDGSTDTSGEILKSYESTRCLIIHQENLGQCAAANVALSKAQGEFIKFFDADDLLAPESIENQIRRLQGRQNAIASSKWGRFYNDLTDFSLNPQTVWRDLTALDWLVEAWADAQPMMQCGIWLIPRLILDQSGGWDESLSLINDFEFFTRVLCHADEVLFTPEATLYYRSGLIGSLSGKKSRKAIESAFHSLLMGTGYLLERRSDQQARMSCANVLQQFVYDVYPDHHDLREVIQQRVKQLGGSNLPVSGGPRFQKLRRLLGWRIAKRVQKLSARSV